MSHKPTDRFPGLDLNRNWLYIWAFCLFGGLAVPQLEIVVMTFFSLRALKGPKETMEGAFVCCFYLLANQIVVEGYTRNFMRYLFLLCSFASLIFGKSKGKVPVAKFLWSFLICFTVVGFLSSRIPAISILKVASFFMGAYIMVEGFSRVAADKKYWYRLINSFFIFLTVGSLLFLALGFGYETNGRGFQGVFSHPQNFGPVMGVVAAWFTGITISQKKPSATVLTLLGLSLTFILMSLARTGMVAFILGGGIAYLLGLGLPQNRRYRAKGIQLGVFAVVVLFVVALANPAFLNETLVSFVQKREAGTTDTSLDELFNQSRGGLTLTSMDNFRENPLLGIGFGVPSNLDTPEDLQNIKYLHGIPVSASVEKGFLPTAILEEIGILGAVATIILLILIVRRVRQRASFPMIWLLMTALFINIGEAIFYSVGGTGFFMWLMLGICYSFSFFPGGKARVSLRNRKFSHQPIANGYPTEIKQLP